MINGIWGRDTGSAAMHDKLIGSPSLGYTVYYSKSQAPDDIVAQASKLYPDFKHFYDKDGNIHHAVAINDYDRSKITADVKEEDVYIDVQELLDLGYTKIRPPKRRGGVLGCWTWSIDTFKKRWNNNEVIIKNNKNIIHKIFIDPDSVIIERNGKRYVRIRNRLPLQNIIDYPTAIGTKVVSDLFPENNTIFNNPKNLDMIKLFIQSSTMSDSIILDFFSGSATTAHAVMQLNAEDVGGES